LATLLASPEVSSHIRLSRGLAVVLGVWMGSLGFALPALAVPGDLDPSFDGDGRVTTNFNFLDEAEDVAIQENGKIVAVGMSAGRFALARYETDGDLDPKFSGNGKVRTDFTSGADRAGGVVIQENGKIVAAGIANIGLDATFALARYTTDGSLDTSFGGDGKVTTDFTARIDGAHDVALQADGAIVAAGIAGSSKHTGTFALARYRPNGTLDDTFSTNGKVRTNFTPGFDGALGVAIQENGRIVAAGTATIPDTTWALARYRASGNLDQSFSDDGKVRTDFGGAFDTAYGVAIQDDGRIVAAGEGDESGGSFNPTFALARYETDGDLDPTFSGDGKVKTNFGPDIDRANAVAIQEDGMIVAAGMAEGDPFDPTFALARYESDGGLDGSFGTGGKVTTNFTSGADEAEGVLIQTDGRIVAAGVADNTEGPGADPTFALARYLAV
jgi:uncharacterized delta-60 repeat protein